MNGPCGAMSIDSSDSRWAPSLGHVTVAGVGAGCASMRCAAPGATVSSVSPFHSDTTPVTRTVSPVATSVTAPDA